MPVADWSVSARLTGEFYIDRVHTGSSKTPLVEGLRTLRIEPDSTDGGPWNGRHRLTATVAVETDAETHTIYERGKHLVASVAALASIGVGRPVVFTNLSVTHLTDGNPPIIRRLTGVDQYANVAAPGPLPLAVLSGSVDAKILRVIRWWSRGIGTSDDVDRLVSLINSADLMAGTMTGVPNRTRTCRHCGTEESIGPGTRERFTYFLRSVGVEAELAEEIYRSRADVAHAGTDFLEDELRRYRDHAAILADAVRTGVAGTLGITLPPTPIVLPLDVASAVLDLTAEGERISDGEGDSVGE
jgi:hypothetical protein